MRKAALLSLALGLLPLSFATAASDGRSYVGGYYALDLGGAAATPLASAEGGSATAEVVEERSETSPALAKKHIGNVKYEDVSMQLSPTSVLELRDWLEGMLEGKPTRRDGSVVACDYDSTSIGELRFTQALVSELSIPTLDAASKDAARMTIKIAPETTRFRPGTGKRTDIPSPASQKRWLPSNFRLKIGDLPCSRVNKIEALTIKQKVVEHDTGELRDYQKEPSSVETPNLHVTFPATDEKPWREWHDDFVIAGKNGDGEELDGSLTFLESDMKTEIFTLNFFHLGIFRLDELPQGPPLPNEPRRVTAELYVERIEIKPASR